MDWEGSPPAEELDHSPQAHAGPSSAGVEEELLDHILATDFSYVRPMGLAEAEVAMGQHGRALDEVVAGLHSEP